MRQCVFLANLWVIFIWKILSVCIMSSHKIVRGIILGHKGAGKTSLVSHILRQDFSYRPFGRTVRINADEFHFNDKKAEFEISDPLGGETFNFVHHNMYRGSQVIFIVTVMATNPEDRNDICKYDNELEYYIEHTQNNLPEGEYEFVFIINKCDLGDESEFYDRSEDVRRRIQKHIPDFNDTIYLTSAYTGENCLSPFKAGFEKGYHIIENSPESKTPSIDVNNNNENEKKGCF